MYKKNNESTRSDVIAPEDFNPIVGKDADLLNGNNFVAFSTTDKGEGVDHYEVRETFWGIEGKYEITQSPYVLKDQTLKSTIYVKAVDKSGNERIEKINPQNRWALLEQFIIIAIILTALVFLFKKVWPKFTER